MHRIAKVFTSGNSQAVRLPREFRFECNEVYVSRRGEAVVLTPRPTTWQGFMEGAEGLSKDFSTEGSPLPKDIKRASLG